MPTDGGARHGTDAVVISGLGLISAVGGTVEESCASLRAGIVRVREIEGVEVEAGEGQPAALQGHPIGETPDGFFQFGKWVRTGAACVLDLVRNGALPGAVQSAFWKRTGLFALAPIVDIDRFLWSLDRNPEGLARFYLDPLMGVLELPVPAEHRRALPLGHAGFADALRDARQEIASGRLDRVIVLGVDSYLDDLTVAWMSRDDRLKTGDHATGALPGEAAACVMLERPEAAAARRAAAQARVMSVAARPAPAGATRSGDARQDATVERDLPALGRAIASVVSDAVAADPGGRPFRGDIILDLNGENWRSTAWGYAQIHLREAVDFAGSREILPAVSFGEIGAASGPAALCVATRSWSRGYARAERALVCCVSDSGNVGAAVLAGPAAGAARHA